MRGRNVAARRWKRGFAQICVVVAWLTLLPQARAADTAEQMRLWSEPMDGFHVVGNIYYVGTRYLSSFLITTPKGHVLLDGATVEAAPLIENNIRKLGFKLADIRYLLNSHAHLDHSGGLAQLKKDSGAKLLASEGDRSALEGGFYLGWEQRHDLDAPPVKVDRVVRDGEEIVLGDVRLKALLAPGHTRGCTSWTMQVTEGGRPLRVLFHCSTSVALNRIAPPLQYAGIVQDYETTFEKLKHVHPDVFLAPHPEFFNLDEKLKRLRAGGANPFIDPAEFPTFLQASADEFRKELARQTATAH